MKCVEFDWKSYVLDEVAGAERSRYERHLAECGDCQSERDALRLTLLTLKRLPDAEPPRRIAFVSDPVIQPSWWQRFWRSGPQAALASSFILALAIVTGAWMLRPPPGTPAPAPVASVDVDQRVQAEVDKRVAAAAMAMRQENQAALARVSELEKKLASQRQQDLRDVRDSFGYLERQLGTLFRNTSQAGGD